MKRLTGAILALTVLGLCAAAAAGTVEPLPHGAEAAEGYFCAEFEDAPGGGVQSLTVRLYVPDEYEASAVEGMAAGDELKINGKTFHVEDVICHEPEGEGGDRIYEAAVREDYFGGIWFEKADETHYHGYMDDCLISSFLAETTVELPWPEGFEYIWFDPAEGDVALPAEEMNAALSDPDLARNWTRYNTFMEMKDGIPVRVSHQDYPLSPDPMDRPAEDE